VLVTGPTGSGKSSTMAAILDRINETHAYHIITIEDPVEFLHSHKRSIIHQRELHSDTPSFALALRAALRQAPKVILVGEMRDKETVEIALEAAETGHLVLSTLHTIDASKTVERIVGSFPWRSSPSFVIASRKASATSFRSVSYPGRTAEVVSPGWKSSSPLCGHGSTWRGAKMRVRLFWTR
jgi:twitching motility protein PilT